MGSFSFVLCSRTRKKKISKRYAAAIIAFNRGPGIRICSVKCIEWKNNHSIEFQKSHWNSLLNRFMQNSWKFIIGSSEFKKDKKIQFCNLIFPFLLLLLNLAYECWAKLLQKRRHQYIQATRTHTLTFT